LATPTTTTRRKPQQRGWLVRVDPDLWIDRRFARFCDREARFGYINSLFVLAVTDGPMGIYPHVALEAEFDASAEHVAAQLTDFGLWTPSGVGYRVTPHRCCYIVADGRQPLPKWLRAAVMERDGYRCVKCSAAGPLAIDHIFPWSRGGEDTLDNLQVLCKPCNSKKSATVPSHLIQVPRNAVTNAATNKTGGA
jgi:5-methylcytosine-specific restriction endonuclease McrA